MLVSDLIRSVRMRINDIEAIGFQEDELLDYVNAGIQWLHNTINRERPELLAVTETIKKEPKKSSKKAIRILEGPEDLIVRMDGTLNTDQKVPFSMRYVPDADNLKNTDTFPYFNVFKGFVVEFAAIRAQARNEFDMNQEKALLGEMEAQILTVIWGVQNERSDLDPYYPVCYHCGDYSGPNY